MKRLSREKQVFEIGRVISETRRERQLCLDILRTSTQPQVRLGWQERLKAANKRLRVMRQMAEDLYQEETSNE